MDGIYGQDKPDPRPKRPGYANGGENNACNPQAQTYGDAAAGTTGIPHSERELPEALKQQVDIINNRIQKLENERRELIWARDFITSDTRTIDAFRAAAIIDRANEQL